MPTLITNGDDFHDVTSTLAVMLWPEDGQDKERKQFYAARYVDHILRGDLTADSEVTLPAGLLSALLDAHAWPALLEEVSKRTKRATVAGHVLSIMFLMDLCKDRLPPRGDPGASLDKAINVMERWAEMDKRFGDNSTFPLSDRTIRNCWIEFRNVAHLWAAKDLNLDPEFQFAPHRQLFDGINLHSFLCAAAYLADFGCSFKLANKSRAPTPRHLLDRNSIWAADPARHPSNLRLPEDLSIFDKAPFMQILRAYHA